MIVRRKNHNNRVAALICLALVLTAMVAMLLAVKPWTKAAYDPESFCPLDGAFPRTAIVVDATDAFDSVQINAVVGAISELRKKLTQYEWIGVFVVNEDNLLLPQPIIALCNPGDKSSANPLYQNPELIRRNFENQFNTPIRNEIAKLLYLPAQNSSPIMEMIAAVAQNNIFAPTQQRRLIIVSDMLQNVQGYSQYALPVIENTYFNEWSKSDYARKIIKPGLLSGVNVELLYVKRREDAARKLQTHQHIEFWRRYLHAMGGNLTRVQPI